MKATIVLHALDLGMEVKIDSTTYVLRHGATGDIALARKFQPWGHGEMVFLHISISLEQFISLCERIPEDAFILLQADIDLNKSRGRK